MNLMRSTAYIAVCSIVIGVPALAANQVATAQGRCGVAVNAADHAQVTINNYCDAGITATVRLLIEKGKKKRAAAESA